MPPFLVSLLFLLKGRHMNARLLEQENNPLLVLNGPVEMSNSHGRRRLPIMVRTGRKSQKPCWPFMELWGLHRRPIDSDGTCIALSEYVSGLILMDIPNRELPVSSLVGPIIRYHRKTRRDSPECRLVSPYQPRAIRAICPP